MIAKAERIKAMLVSNGYENALSVLNEWNYVRGWTDDFQYSINAIHGVKGAAFVMACICAAQKCDAIDMLMYYDTRPSAFCCAFDFYTYEPLKGYYPLMWYGKFYDMASEIRCEAEPKNIYTLCGTDKDGKILCAAVRYSDDDSASAEKIRIDFGRKGTFEIYAVDKEDDGGKIALTEQTEFRQHHTNRGARLA